jgi:hypothetical protein
MRNPFGAERENHAKTEPGETADNGCMVGESSRCVRANRTARKQGNYSPTERIRRAAMRLLLGGGELAGAKSIFAALLAKAPFTRNNNNRIANLRSARVLAVVAIIAMVFAFAAPFFSIDGRI